jgi:hypothetical protein
MKLLLSITILFCSAKASSQLIKEPKAASNSIEQELKTAKANEKQDYILWDKKLVLPNKDVAIKVAEPILFAIYGEKNILQQKPYNVSLRENKWIITGSIHSEKGGSFLIILDARNSKVLRVIHGK